MPSSIEQLIQLVKDLKEVNRRSIERIERLEKLAAAHIIEINNLKKQVLFIQGRLSIKPQAFLQGTETTKIKEEKPAPAQAPPAQAPDSKPAEGPPK